MNDIFDFLKNNSSWLKDVFTIVFTATGTFVAILSYKRAKSSIFQPKRTEVAKVQTELLMDFLTTFTTDGNSIDRAIDYLKIYQYNVGITLRDYNLADIDKISENYGEYVEYIAGWFQFPEKDNLSYILVEGSIKEYDNLIFEPNNREHQKYHEREAKDGVFKIHRIFYTKKYDQFHKKLVDLSNNPFLPTEIQQVANQIGDNMSINLQKLRALLSTLIKEIHTAYIDKTSNRYEVISKTVKYQTLENFRRRKKST